MKKHIIPPPYSLVHLPFEVSNKSSFYLNLFLIKIPEP